MKKGAWIIGLFWSNEKCWIFLRLASIAQGGIAQQAFYSAVVCRVREALQEDLLRASDKFNQRYGLRERQSLPVSGTFFPRRFHALCALSWLPPQLQLHNHQSFPWIVPGGKPCRSAPP